MTLMIRVDAKTTILSITTPTTTTIVMMTIRLLMTTLMTKLKRHRNQKLIAAKAMATALTTTKFEASVRIMCATVRRAAALVKMSRGAHAPLFSLPLRRAFHGVGARIRFDVQPEFRCDHTSAYVQTRCLHCVRRL